MSVKETRFRVIIAPHGHEFEVAPSQTILAAALGAGIVLPSSCRNGTCRECMCKLVSGNVSYKIDWPGLSREEKAENFILPCVATPESDLLVEQPRARKAS